MNIASVVVICILAVLLILVVVCSRKNKEGECGGNCDVVATVLNVSCVSDKESKV